VTRDSSGAALRQKVGVGAQVTRGGPGAAPSREREPEPRGHLAASELPLAGRREPLCCLDLKFVRGVPGRQGTDTLNILFRA
jgi:hypothetical protein